MEVKFIVENNVTLYLNRKISKIVDSLFLELEKNNIDIKKRRTELSMPELNTYLKIYNTYEYKLIKLKNDTIQKYQITENIDYAFGMITNSIINNKLKKL